MSSALRLVVTIEVDTPDEMTEALVGLAYRLMTDPPEVGFHGGGVLDWGTYEVSHRGSADGD